MLPPAKWAEVVLLGVVNTLNELQRRAQSGAYRVENGGRVAIVPLGEVRRVVKARWSTTAAQASNLNALRHVNQTNEELAHRKNQALYPGRPLSIVSTQRSGLRDEGDIGGLTPLERAQALLRRHRYEIRKLIAAATLEYLAAPADSLLRVLFTRLLAVMHLELSKLVCPHTGHGHLREQVVADAETQRCLVAKQALEGKLHTS